MAVSWIYSDNCGGVEGSLWPSRDSQHPFLKQSNLLTVQTFLVFDCKPPSAWTGTRSRSALLGLILIFTWMGVTLFHKRPAMFGSHELFFVVQLTTVLMETTFTLYLYPIFFFFFLQRSVNKEDLHKLINLVRWLCCNRHWQQTMLNAPLSYLLVPFFLWDVRHQSSSVELQLM